VDLKTQRRVLAGGFALCITLIVGGLVWRELLLQGRLPEYPPEASKWLPTLHPPLIELLKMVAALGIGVFVTTVHRFTSTERKFSTSMEHAQILLCVAGALVMIIIGDSLARAFGIAGAASIIRFRTPVEDPKDTIILFLSLALGMASGLGAFAVAGFAAAFLVIVMILLANADPGRKRVLYLTISSSISEFPTSHVMTVLSRHRVEAETRGLTEGPESVGRYRVHIPAGVSLDDISAELREHPTSGIRSVVWDKARKLD
jgi:hypothetical protein